MVNTQAILRSDLFLNAIRAAGGSSRHSSLQEQFNLRDWDLGAQQKRRDGLHADRIHGEGERPAEACQNGRGYQEAGA